MFPRIAVMERKIFSADKKISSPTRAPPLRNSAGQDSSSSVLLTSSLKFLRAIWLRCNDMQLPVLFNVSFPFIWVEVHVSNLSTDYHFTAL